MPLLTSHSKETCSDTNGTVLCFKLGMLDM